MSSKGLGFKENNISPTNFLSCLAIVQQVLHILLLNVITSSHKAGDWGKTIKLPFSRHDQYKQNIDEKRKDM